MLSAFRGTGQFIDLVNEKYPEINLEIIPYSGANMTGYMRDEITTNHMPDIYVTTVYFPGQEDFSDHLIDLSGYDFTNNCYEMTFFNRKSQRTFTCQIVQNTKRHLKRAKTMQISGIGHSVIRGLVTTGQWFSASTTVYPRGSPQGRRHSYFVDC